MQEWQAKEAKLDSLPRLCTVSTHVYADMPGMVQVMNEEILPACERLRREKGQYMEWQAENAKLDSLRRFCVAFRYVDAQR